MRLVYIALSWALGLALAAGAAKGHPLLWLGLLAAALLVLLLARRQRASRLAGVLLISAALGGLRLSMETASSEIAQYNDLGGLTIVGTVVGAPDARDTGVRLRVAADTVTRNGESAPASGLVLVEAPATTTARYGDRVRVTGLPRTPQEFDTFSYADYLARAHIFSVVARASVEVVEPNAGTDPRRALTDTRDAARRAIEQHLPEPQASLLSGIILGVEQGLAPEVRDAFAATGAAHVIAISGFNMVVVSAALLWTLERLRVPHNSAALLAIGFVALYTLFVGANPAVVRAALMSMLLIAGTRLRRKTYVPASLAFAAIALSALQPFVLWDISFQLSFAATLGLALFGAPVSAWLDRLLRPAFPGWLRAFVVPMLGATLAAQVTVTPLIALYFGRLSLVIIPVNLLILPVQPLVLVLGGLAVATALVIPLVAQLVFWVALVPLAWTSGVVRAFARLPFAEVAFSIHPALVALFFVILAGGAILHATQPEWALRVAAVIRRRLVLATAGFAGFSIIALTAAVVVSRPDNRLHVWFLDVGHSNAILAQTPGGAQILIDGGRYPSRLLTAIGDRLPFNDREIEVVALTQPDENDYGAVTSVLDRYDAGLVLTTGQPNLSDTYAALEARLTRHERIVAEPGLVLDLNDGTRLEVLGPEEQPALGDSVDDNALVLRLSYGDFSILLVSDLSAAGQRRLMERGVQLAATALQVPRHAHAGSLDESFLAAVQPQVAFLQSDRANRLGDPDPDVLAMLDDTPLFRTDTGGTVHLWTDGHDMWVVDEGASGDAR